MMLHVVVNVTAHLIWRASLEGRAEILGYYHMVAVVFLPLLGVKQCNELIRAEILDAVLPLRAHDILDVIWDLALAGWLFLFNWSSVSNALRFTLKHFPFKTTHIRNERRSLRIHAV